MMKQNISLWITYFSFYNCNFSQLKPLGKYLRLFYIAQIKLCTGNKNEIAHFLVNLNLHQNSYYKLHFIFLKFLFFSVISTVSGCMFYTYTILFISLLLTVRKERKSNHHGKREMQQTNVFHSFWVLSIRLCITGLFIFSSIIQFQDNVDVDSPVFK